MNIKVILLILVLIGAGVFLAMQIETREPWQITSRPRDAVMPTEKKSNDTIILVKNASHDQVKQAVSEFLNGYNHTRQQLVVELKPVSADEFAIVFPYDVHLNVLLYMVNALYYPKGFDYKPDVLAWATAKPGDPWSLSGMGGKSVMIYLPESDTTHALLTTSDNVGFKMSFAFKSQNQKLDNPPMNYQSPPVTAAQLAGISGEELY